MNPKSCNLKTSVLLKTLLRMRCFTLCALLVFFFLFGMGTQLFFSNSVKMKNTQMPIFVWWTSRFPGDTWKLSSCRHGHVCQFTNNKKYKEHQNTEGFLFYGSDFDYLDLPLPRNSEWHIWGLLHEESPRNTPILSHSRALEIFNYSSTISRFSDVPLTLQYLRGFHELLDTTYFIETKKKNKLLKELSPVLYIQSDCDTASDRDNYVKELMKHISVDSYGKCLNNKKLPKEFSGDYLNSLNSAEFLNFVGQYKFTVSFENGICFDYITEKLWRPLSVGSVPIYLGSPSVRDWLPNDRSAIISTDFQTPKQLAAYLEYLNNHDDEYEKYLQHKVSNQITNFKLIDSLKQRTWSIDAEDSNESFVEAFECFICRKAYERHKDEDFTPSVVTQKHYDCPKPLAPLRSTMSASWWLSEWHNSKKQAEILYKLVILENRDNFTESEFFNENDLLQ